MTAHSELPRAYRQRVSPFWWAKRPSYALFVIRELSCVAVAWFVVYLLLAVRAIGAGSADYKRFLDWSANSFVIAINVVALALVLLHTVTWFGLAPRAMVVRMPGGRKVPSPAILAAHYLAWASLSALIAWLVLR